MPTIFFFSAVRSRGATTSPGSTLLPHTVILFFRDCGEMTARDDSMERAPTCASKPAILYAWAKEAPELTLPQGSFILPSSTSGLNIAVFKTLFPIWPPSIIIGLRPF